MSNPFVEGDEAKNKYLNQALHANEASASDAKMSDLFDKKSDVYQDAEKKNAVPEEKTPLPERPTVDAEGYPIIEQVHTYKEDLADIVKEDKLSLTRIAMMQGKAQQNIPTQTPPQKKQSKIFIIASGALVLLGIGIVGGVLMLSAQKKTPEVQPENQTPKEKYIVFSESKKLLDVTNRTKTELANTIKTTTQNFKEEDNIMEISPLEGISSTSPKAPLQDIWDITDSHIPSDLQRTLADRFFLGLYSKKGHADPFLIFYTSSYDIAYPALLDWEGFMQDDFDWIYDTKIKTGTSTIPLSFKDRIIANKNARSFEDATGRTAFFYLFLDEHTILFARSSDTVRKVMDRIREAKFQ